MEIPKNEESALDTIEHELYDPKKQMDDITMHSTRATKTQDLPTSWGEVTPIIKEVHDTAGISFGAKVLIGSCILLFLSLSFTAWRVLSSRNVVSSASIDMSAEIVPYIEGGQATPLIVTLQNRNGSTLESATLTLLYKKGTGAQDEQEKVTIKREIGSIGVNEYKKQDFEVTLYGSESEVRDISLKLEYKVSGSNAVFNKVLTTSVILKTPPLSVHIDGPDLLSVGQVGTFTISVKNNTATTSLPSSLQLFLPTNFSIENISPKPSTRGQIWTIPTIPEGQEKKFVVTGGLSGSQGETNTIRALIGSQGGSAFSVGVVYASTVFDVKLRTSPLTISTSLETDRGSIETLRYGDRATLVVNYVNESNQPLRDTSFVLTLGGEAPLFKEIIPGDGYYDSKAQTITWNKSSVSNLASLLPGAQGTFRIVIPIVTKGINSPALSIDVDGAGTLEEKNDVTTSLSKKWVVQGSATLSAQTTYKNSPFQSSGPIPPQANVETSYTAHIVVSAQNALVNSKVSFILPAYVGWENTTSNSQTISYDTNTRTVTWNIGKVDAGKTVSADILLVVRPSQSHVGNSPPITSGIVLDADEEVGKSHIRTTISALTTAIAGENWSFNPSRVVDQ